MQLLKRLTFGPFLITMCGCASRTAMPPGDDLGQRNGALINRHLQLMNSGAWEQAADYFAEDMRHQGIARGERTMRSVLGDIFATFPDWKMEIVEMVASGENVIVRCRVTGTHRGMATTTANGGLLKGVPPTGKSFEIQHTHWYRVRNGRIAEHFATRDDLGLMKQLGLIPAEVPAQLTPRPN